MVFIRLGLIAARSLVSTVTERSVNFHARLHRIYTLLADRVGNAQLSGVWEERVLTNAVGTDKLDELRRADEARFSFVVKRREA